MPIKFNPIYSLTPEITTYLMQIEAVKSKASLLPMHPHTLASLRETANIFTTHYATMIEGNRLTQEEVKEVLTLKGHFPGRTRDEYEVKGYYTALATLEQ
jgi:hypothetical protein